MSTFTSVFSSVGETTTGTVLTTASSAEIVIGPNRIFSITCSDDLRIKFGTTGMGAAVTGDFPVWGNAYVQFDTASHTPSIRLFNPTAGTVTYWITYLAR